MSAAPANQSPEPEVTGEILDDGPHRRPTLRVVRGDATPEEIAAILAVVARRTTPPPEDRLPQQRSAWTDRARQLGARPAPGPGAWRAAGTF